MVQQSRTGDLLTRMRLRMAEDTFRAESLPAELAWLAQVLRQDPANAVAAERLVSALTCGSFPLPTVEPLPHDGAVTCVQFSPDGRRLVTASADGTARVWDAENGDQLAILRGHTEAVRVASFSPDGRVVVAATEDGLVRLWDYRTGKVLLLKSFSSSALTWLR